MELTVRAAEYAENMYSYTQSKEIMKQAGCIGLLRVDMGRDSNEFYTSWDNHDTSLNTQEFRQELNGVINELRKGMLKDRRSLRKYCSTHAEAAMQDEHYSFCFRADTRERSYILRLNPTQGNYAAYCYCYRREDLDKALNGSVQDKGEKTVDYQILQLKDGPENRDIRFASLSDLDDMKRDVDLANYKCVWKGKMPEGTDLETIFRKFNIEKPEGFAGHSMSVSDIILITSAEKTKSGFSCILKPKSGDLCANGCVKSSSLSGKIRRTDERRKDYTMPLYTAARLSHLYATTGRA